nr:terminase family protein [Helicobacter magdeburgensis]
MSFWSKSYSMASPAKQEIFKRIRAKKDFKSFVLLKWERYEKKPFMDNWHYDYLCKILEHTLPSDDLALGNHSLSLHSEPTRTTQQTQGGEVFASDFKGCEALSARSYLSGSAEAREANSLKSTAKTSPELITRLMLNMPPSYGKTEIIARCFIAWALGNYPQRKFIYISYSDDLCRKISNQVRDLIKSPFFASVFGKNPLFLQDNANEFVLKEGGGLFVTTLKSAITGFHAHQILIDDPIKVSAMNSKAERNLVNQNFKESVLSRLQDNKSNITILMQRLGDEDLCGFLLDKKNFESHIINEWKQISLKAINKERETYTIGDYNHIREPNTPLFPQRHNNKDLELLKLQMGEDEFSTQYLQEPMVSEAGFFELAYFKEIPSYECQNQNLYIFVDSALSLNANADNRAIVLIGVENYENTLRYVVRDCVFGIWEESQTIQELISLMLDNPKAKVYIESDGGGLTLERLLLTELVKVNNQRKINAQPQITNSIKCYTPSRKISKIEKIKALKPFYNTGFLVFLHNARGLAQIKKELLGFNPAKPFRKDDCIDCIASCVAHSEVIAPSFGASPKELKSPIERLRQKARSQRVAWNF